MSLPLLTPWHWTLAIIAALCVGLSKGGFGGVGVFTILLMAEVMPARESTGAVLPLLICGDILAVAVFRKHAQWAHIWRMMPATLAGVVAGYWLMDRIPAGIFRAVMGWIILVMIVVHYLRQLWPAGLQQMPQSRWFAWAMGVLAGSTTMLANAAGPVMTLYLLAVRLPKLEFVGTAAWFFLLVNLAKVPFSAHLGLINGASLHLDLLLAPVVALGIFGGRALLKVVSQAVFEHLLLVFAAIVSLRLIWAA